MLPKGFVAQAFARGQNTPVHCCFDDQGFCYVVECGHKVDARPRVLKIDITTGASTTFFEWPEDRWIPTGDVTCACWHEGYLYIANTDRLSRIGSDGSLFDIVTDLPGLGNHQAITQFWVRPKAWYWGQGSVTNRGVVGAYNFAYEWLPKFPHPCHVPAQDVTLVGRNYEYRNVLGNVGETCAPARTCRYTRYGTMSWC